MITIQQSNIAPHDKCFTSGFKCVKSACKPTLDVIDCCGGCYLDINKVYSNDKSSFFDYLQLESFDTVTYKLCYNGNETILNGTTYSILDVNGSNYYLCVDWEKVHIALGSGKYTIKTERVVLGVEVNSSVDFILCEYDPCDTEGSIQIKYWLTGSFKDGRTYCDYEFGLRIEGELKEIDPIEEIEQYKNKDCEVENISSGIYKRYELETHSLSKNQIDEIYKTLAHADKIKITNYQDYIQPNGYLIRENGLSITNIGDKTFYNITFVDKKQDNFKTLCK